MTRIREVLTTFFLGCALYTMPRRGEPRRRRSGPDRTARTFYVHPSAIDGALRLRCLADEVERGVVIGARVIWHGAPQRLEILIVTPRAIGEA